MTEVTSQDVVKLQETIQSLQLDKLTLNQCYTEEINKNINQKSQIIVLSAQLEQLKKLIQIQREDEDKKEQGKDNE